MKSTLLINSFDGIDRNKNESRIVNTLSQAARRVNNNGMREEIKSFFFYEIINKAIATAAATAKTIAYIVCMCVRIFRSHLVACLPILGRYTFYRDIYI